MVEFQIKKKFLYIKSELSKLFCNMFVMCFDIYLRLLFFLNEKNVTVVATLLQR